MGRRQPTFKPYYQRQVMLLPPSLDELIPKDHACRVVNDVINNINLEPLTDAYHLKGSSSYHPQTLLKVLVYGYVSNIYSSRKLEAVCKESIYFIGAARRFLSAMSYPDHNTINRLRGVRLKDALRKIFEEVAQSVAATENDLPDPPDFTTINKEKVQDMVAKLLQIGDLKKSVCVAHTDI